MNSNNWVKWNDKLNPELNAPKREVTDVSGKIGNICDWNKTNREEKIVFDSLAGLKVIEEAKNVIKAGWFTIPDHILDFEEKIRNGYSFSLEEVDCLLKEIDRSISTVRMLGDFNADNSSQIQ